MGGAPNEVSAGVGKKLTRPKISLQIFKLILG